MKNRTLFTTATLGICLCVFSEDICGQSQTQEKIQEKINVRPYSINVDSSPTTTNKETPTYVVEQMPSFPGGETALMAFIGENLRYPSKAAEAAIQGRVSIRFVVSANGTIEDVVVLKSVDPSLDAEAVRVIKSMPKWIPGKQNEKNVSVYYILPILFRLNS
jgi:TonB family protein